jgi:SulP family sulfate permease
LPFQLRVKNWQSYIPIVPVLRGYRRADFSHDLVGGIILGVITVPQAIAYALLAGLPAEAGLYASVVPMVIYAIFGSSRHLMVGPVAITALMVAAAVGQYAPRYGMSYASVSTVLCLQAGIFLWLLRLWQMGGLVNLLSHPVIIGFVNAAALLIIISQIPAFTGITGATDPDPYHQVVNLATHIGSVDAVVLALALSCVVGLWLVRRYAVPVLRLVFRDLPDNHPACRIGPILVTAVATLAVVLWNLDDARGVTVVGSLPAGLPKLSVPQVAA